MSEQEKWTTYVCPDCGLDYGRWWPRDAAAICPRCRGRAAAELREVEVVPLTALTAERAREARLRRKAGMLAARAKGLQTRLHEALGGVETARRMCADGKSHREIDEELAGIADGLAILPTPVEDPEQPEPRTRNTRNPHR